MLFSSVGSLVFINTTIKGLQHANLVFIRTSNQSITTFESLLYENNSISLIYSESGVINITKSVFRNNDLKSAAVISLKNTLTQSFLSSLHLHSLEIYNNNIGIFLDGEGVHQILASYIDFFRNKPNEENSGGGFLQVLNYNLTHLTSCNFYALSIINMGLIGTSILSRDGK
jgi:hypothetical protein